jgi:hypothetical protein
MDNATQDPGSMTGAPTSESIDLLIRHLEIAKQIAGGSAGSLAQDNDFTTPDVMCTLFYAVPGTFCPLLYFHVPTVKAE